MHYLTKYLNLHPQYTNGFILGTYVVQSYKMTGVDNNSGKENFYTYPISDYIDDFPQDLSNDGPHHITNDDYPSKYDEPFDDSIFDGPPVDNTTDNSVSAETVPSDEKEGDAVIDVEFPTKGSKVDKSRETESPTNADRGNFQTITNKNPNSVNGFFKI